MIVLDASSVLDLLLLSEPYGEAVAGLLREHDGDAHAPHLLDAEVAQVLRRFVVRGDLPIERAGRALNRLDQLPLIRYPHGPLLRRAFALRENCTIYDALYIALAEALGAVLVTRDRGLAKIPGATAAVEIVGEARR